MYKAKKVLEPLILLFTPVLLVISVVFQVKQALILTTVVAFLSILSFLFQFEKLNMKPRDIMPIVIISAIASCGRILTVPIGGVNPVTALVILGAICFGKQSGFVIGVFSALISNMFLGQGLWTPWQMYAWGLIGYVAGMIHFKKNIFIILFGILTSYLFGIFMDTWFIVGFINPITIQKAVLAYGAGMLQNTFHAISTGAFLGLLVKPWKKKVLRLKIKYGLHNLSESAL